MTQRHVVPAYIAELMFPELMGFGNGVDIAPAEITWLVGPIVCEHCGSVGTEPDAVDYACTRCDGIGYPPTVEIVSEMEVHPGNEPYDVVHGVVKLGKPVPIFGTCGKVPTDIECIITIAGQADRVWHSRPPNDFTNPIADTTSIADNIGPCEPGQVAYSVEVVR